MKVAGLRGQPGRGLEAGLAGAELEMESGPMFGSNSDIITQNTAHTINNIHYDEYDIQGVPKKSSPCFERP